MKGETEPRSRLKTRGIGVLEASELKPPEKDQNNMAAGIQT